MMMDTKKKRNISIGLALILTILTMLSIQIPVLRDIYPIPLAFTCLWWAWSGFWSAIVWREKILIIKEDPILDEIGKLFDKIKEADIMASQFEEEREIIASNLILAYYMIKLERKMK